MTDEQLEHAHKVAGRRVEYCLALAALAGAGGVLVGMYVVEGKTLAAGTMAVGVLLNWWSARRMFRSAATLIGALALRAEVVSSHARAGDETTPVVVADVVPDRVSIDWTEPEDRCEICDDPLYSPPASVRSRRDGRTYDVCPRCSISTEVEPVQ